MTHVEALEPSRCPTEPDVAPERRQLVGEARTTRRLHPQAEFGVDGCRFDMADHTRRVAVKEFSNNARNSQETNLFHNFAALVLRGKPDPFWAEIALQTQQVMDACLASSRQEGKLVALPV